MNLLSNASQLHAAEPGNRGRNDEVFWIGVDEAPSLGEEVNAGTAQGFEDDYGIEEGKSSLRGARWMANPSRTQFAAPVSVQA